MAQPRVQFQSEHRTKRGHPKNQKGPLAHTDYGDAKEQIDTWNKKRTLSRAPVNPEPIMSQSTAPESQADADRLEAAADQAIAVCGGDVRAALKAMIVANEFLESEVSELMKAVSRAYVRGRFQTYSG
jgi:hypothetical protein